MGTKRARRAFLGEDRDQRFLAACWFVLMAGALLFTGCQMGSPTPPPTSTPEPAPVTPTPTLTPTLSAAEMGLFPSYAQGERLPHMQVPIQRSAEGEGGWYVVIGTAEGWAQFLSEMGQPAEIWEPVQWQDEILVGALLGVRQGRGYRIAITHVDLDGVTANVELVRSEPTSDQAVSNWVTDPFHLIRVPRSELALGVVTFRFLEDGVLLAERDVDMIDLDIAWIPGPAATFPTPTPVPTTVPVPTATATPVPSLKVAGTVLEVLTDTLRLRILPAEGDWAYVELMEGTSIFEGGQPASLSELAPGSAISALGYAQEGRPGSGRTMRAAHIEVVAAPAEGLTFGRYQPRSVSLSTLYDGYRLPLDTEQISSRLPLSAALSVTQTAVLTRNGFVVAPARYTSFDALYASDAAAHSSESGTDSVAASDAVYVTADSVLHVTRLTLEQVWRAVQEQHLARELAMLDREMATLCLDQVEAARQTDTTVTALPSAVVNQAEFSEIALRCAAYFSIGVSLLDLEYEAPDALAPIVQAELALISSTQAITVSPLLDLPGLPEGEQQRIDYRAFALDDRGLNETSARTHRALTWHRLVALRPEQMAETRLAAYISTILETESSTRVLWQRLQSLLTYVQGRDASYLPPEYAALVAELEHDADPASGPAGYVDQGEWSALRSAIQDLPLPAHPIWTIWADKRPIERQWRLFSQPFQVEEYVFEQTTGANVGPPDAPRRLPSGIDLSAALGSLEAYRVATELGYNEQMGYVEQVDAVRNELSAVPSTYWTQEQHWNWLYVYRSLLGEKNASYPAWMRTSATERSAIQAQLGSWTHLLREVGAAGPAAPTPGASGSAESPLPAPEGVWGYVEPQPEVYARLAALVQQVVDGLDARLMLGAKEQRALAELEDWLVFLQDSARRELISPSLTEAEYARLGRYGEYLAQVTQSAYGDAGLEGASYHEAVAVPLARAGSGPEGMTLVEATGMVDEIYVVIERGRQLYLARGGVYSYYELTWPSMLPLDDTIWRERLAQPLAPGGGTTGPEGEQEPVAEQGPARPAWVGGFVVGD